MSKKLIIVSLLLFAVAVATIPTANAASGKKRSPAKCIVLISMKIRPYMEAVEGIKAFLNKTGDIETEFFFLEDLGKSWENFKYSAVVALGPEALLFLKSNPPDTAAHKVFTMVLNPFSLIPRESFSCGIFLSADPREQIKWIKEITPQIRKIGILFDPANNAEYLAKALNYASRKGLVINPMAVRSKKEVPDLLRKNWRSIDGLLLIPDATVISSPLVKSIIKEGLSNGVPVIGYNRFFIRSGALMAFVYDYEQIGKQTGSLVRELIRGEKNCGSSPAEFKVIVNSRIAHQLDISILNTQKIGIIKEE